MYCIFLLAAECVNRHEHQINGDEAWITVLPKLQVRIKVIKRQWPGADKVRNKTIHGTNLFCNKLQVMWRNLL